MTNWPIGIGIIYRIVKLRLEKWSADVLRKLVLMYIFSGMLVRDPSKSNDVDAIFNQATLSGAVEGPGNNVRPSSSSRNFTGTGRLLTGERVSSEPQPPESVTHNIVFWSNGFTVDDGPLRRLDDPANASFLEVMYPIVVMMLSFLEIDRIFWLV